MPPLTPAQIQTLIQFNHPRKTLGRLPGAETALSDDLLADLFGISLAEYQAIVAAFAANARQAATELLADPEFADRIDRLPFKQGETVVGLGDSITDDLQSWFEILRHLLELRRAERAPTLINAGVSSDTTAQGIARFIDVATQGPDWIICMLGTNDARRHGESPQATLVSPQETAKNLTMLHHFARAQTTARWIWMTPARAIEAWIADDWLLAGRQASWRNKDLEVVADLIRRQDDPVVDLQAAFDRVGPEACLLPDGLHPNITGQRVIAQALVEHLTE